MAVDVKKGSHIVAFPSKVASFNAGSPHIYNITVADDTDNGTLVGRGDWNSFDNYKATTAPEFSGIIRTKGTLTDNSWYVEVAAETEALLVYNSPESPYSETELKDKSLYYNESGSTTNGLSLIKGDLFEVSANAFDGTPKEGATVSYASGKYKVATGA